MKPLEFLGSSYEDFLEFPKPILQKAGYQLHLIQMGSMPIDFKSMLTVGRGVQELRLKDTNGIYRVVYTAKVGDCIYVLHAFKKKTQKTPQSDIELAKKRLKDLLQQLQEQEQQENNHE